MPELPEIETIRRGLERETVGRRVKSVEVPVAKAVHRNGSRKAFQARLEGAKISRASTGAARCWCSRSTAASCWWSTSAPPASSCAPRPRTRSPRTPRSSSPSPRAASCGWPTPRATAEAFVVTHRPAARRGARARQPGPRSGGVAGVVDGVRPVAGQPPQREAQAAAARPDLRRGPRRPVRRRDPPRRRPAARPRGVDGVDHGDPPALPVAGRDPARGHQAPRHLAPTSTPSPTCTARQGSFQDELQVWGRDGEPCRRCRQTVTKPAQRRADHLLVPELPGLTAVARGSPGACRTVT